MATPPTFVAHYEGASWDTTTSPKTTGTFNTSANDALVSLVGEESDVGTENFTWTNSVTALTWTEKPETTGTTNSDGWAQAATAIASAITGTAVTATRTAGSALKYNHATLHFSGSDGIGGEAHSTAGTSGAPSLSITTTADNSAIVCIFVDWNAADGASRTWRTVNGITPTAGNGLERVYFRNASNYTVYVAYYSDAGTAGAKTIGLSAPSGQRWVGIAVEVKGAAGGAAPLAGAPVVIMQALNRAATY